MCRFNVSLPEAGGDDVVQFDEKEFNWFDAIESYADDEDALEAPAQAGEEPAAGLDLVDWFSNQIAGELGTTGFFGANTGVAAQIMKQEEVYALDQLAPAAAEASSCQSADSEEQQHHSPSPSLPQQNMNNSVDAEKNVKPQAPKRAPRVNYFEPAEDKIERVKQKRRESAQRSRARKNAYMKELENENAALKQQVEQLQQALTRLQAYMGMAGPAMAGTGMPCF